MAAPLAAVVLSFVAIHAALGLRSTQAPETLLDEAARPIASDFRQLVLDEMEGSHLRPIASDFRQLVLDEMEGNYSHTPRPEQWQQLLEHALSSPQDPCDADVLSTFGWNSGWGSGFNVLASDVAVAAYFGRTVAVCNPPGLDRSMWYVLRGPLRVCWKPELCKDISQYGTEGRLHWGYSAIFWGGCLDHDECDVTSTKMPKRPPAQRHPGISPSFRAFAKRFRHLVYERIYRFDPFTDAAVKRLEAQFGPRRRPYVGVHVRGTDKFKEAVKVGIKPYIKHALRLAKLTSANAVFLASDDHARAMTFKSIFEAMAPSNMSLHMKPEESYPLIRGGYSIVGIPRAIFMAEINLLRDAAAFVGTASSNVGRLVYFLRPHPNTSGDLLEVSVDEGNDFFSRHC